MNNLKIWLNQMLTEGYKSYDAEVGLLTREVDYRKSGYHSKIFGTVHDINKSAVFAETAMLSEEPVYKAAAKKILEVLTWQQDLEPDSPTRGLWSYFYEQPISEMLAPDWNWANFIGKRLVTVLALCSHQLEHELKEKMEIAVREAAWCSIRRNAKPGYTNISLMSSFLEIAAGEVLGDTEIFEMGKMRLKEFMEFTTANTGFQEYNSSCYTPVAMLEISRMLAVFKDEECLRMAKELNEFAWDNLASHYNINIMQLTAPQARSYTNVETDENIGHSSVRALIYIGTGGKYGKVAGIWELLYEMLSVPVICPEKCLDKFAFKEDSFLAHAFFKTGNGRKIYPNEYDMTAYSYMTKKYSIGCMSGGDMWVQRRYLMAVWGKEKPCYIRLRAIHNDYDFCSGIEASCQYKNKILTHIGFCRDRGSFHISLDKNKSGIYEAYELLFKMELGGYTEEAWITQEGSRFWVRDRGITVCIDVSAWKYDGKNAQFRLNKEAKAIEFVCFANEPQTFDLNNLSDSYGVFTTTIDTKEEIQVPEVVSVVSGDYIESYLKEMPEIRVKSPRIPKLFQETFV